MWEMESLAKWEVPQVLKEYVPHGMVGYDNEGSPIIVSPLYNFDIWGLLHSVTRLDFQRYLVLILDRYQQMGIDRSIELGPKARKLVIFFDISDFNLKQYAWRPAAECMISTIKLYESRYSELLKTCYIVNAPKFFSVGFAVLRKFLDQNTLKKIKIHKIGNDKWKKELFSHVDPDIFPKCFGGNYIEGDGDAGCKTKINWGGKVPKELYIDKNASENSDIDFTDAIITKGNKLTLEFDVGDSPQGDQILSWAFRTLDYDIKFGVFSIDSVTGEERSEVEIGTVFSNEIDEIGFIATRPNTKYTVVFDNSYSYWRSKKLRYCVSLVPDVDVKFTPQSEITETNSAAKNMVTFENTNTSKNNNNNNNIITAVSDIKEKPEIEKNIEANNCIDVQMEGNNRQFGITESTDATKKLKISENTESNISENMEKLAVELPDNIMTETKLATKPKSIDQTEKENDLNQFFGIVKKISSEEITKHMENPDVLHQIEMPENL